MWVEPQRNDVDPYNLIVLLPNEPFANGGESVVRFLCDMFLEKGDRFMLMKLPDHPSEVGKDVPIISYDPDAPSEYYWLTPPKYRWH